MSEASHSGRESRPVGERRRALLYLVLLLLLCAAYSWQLIGSGADAWEHAAVGRWIWQHGTVPQHTLFLWSSHQSWIAHSWLTGLVLFGLMSAGGETVGPFLWLGLNALLTASAFGLIWWLWSRCGRITALTPFLFILGIQASAPRFQVRPESFTAVFFVLLLIFLVNRTRESPSSRRCLFWLPLLFAIWTNIHGGMAFGLLLLGATVFADMIQDRADSRARRLLLAGALCVAATLLNPYGWRYWTIFGQIHSITFSMIDEWKPLWNAPIVGPEILVAQAVLLALAIVVWLWNPQRRWAHALWLAVMTAAAVEARRNGWLLCLTCLVVLAAHAPWLETERLWHEWRRQRSGASGEEDTGAARFIPPALRRGAHLLAAVTLMFVIWFIRPLHPMHVVAVPEHVVRFIQSRRLPGRLYNHYNPSPYLQWRFHGEPPLFIDTLNAYPDSVTMDYIQMRMATPRGRQLFDELGIGAVMMPRLEPGEQAPPLFAYLQSDPRWQLVYVEDDGIVWLRRQTKPTNPR